MSGKRYLRVKNFDETQMYKDRNPIWIKLPCAILDDYEFSAISDETKFHALGLMLLASRLNNKFPDDEGWLRRKINANSEINIENLIEIGFLEVFKAETMTCKPKKTKGKSVKQSEKLCNTEQNRTDENRTDENRTQHNRTSGDEKDERAEANAPKAVVCDFSKSFQTESASEIKIETETESGNGFNKLTVVPDNSGGTANLSQFTLAECLNYVERCIAKGDAIKNPHGLATSLFQTGKADAFIRALMFPEDQKQSDLAAYGAPRLFSSDPCRVCFGAKMADADGRGYRKCEHCKNERGAATGFEPQGE